MAIVPEPSAVHVALLEVPREQEHRRRFDRLPVRVLPPGAVDKALDDGRSLEGV